jgi:hypothetical protein
MPVLSGRWIIRRPLPCLELKTRKAPALPGFSETIKVNGLRLLLL